MYNKKFEMETLKIISDVYYVTFTDTYPGHIMKYVDVYKPLYAVKVMYNSSELVIITDLNNMAFFDNKSLSKFWRDPSKYFNLIKSVSKNIIPLELYHKSWGTYKIKK